MHKRGRTNGGSLDAMDDFLGECSSNVIIFGGVEIKLVDFGRSVVSINLHVVLRGQYFGTLR